MNAGLKAYLESEMGALKAKGIFRPPRVLQTAAGPRVPEQDDRHGHRHPLLQHRRRHR